jgi:hypothetical protein
VSTYPGAIDSLPNVVNNTTIQATTTNNIQSAVLAIENTLGVNPQMVGPGYSTVAVALAASLAGANLYLASSFT